MDRFKITEVRAILIFLVINFITLSIIFGTLNYDAQRSLEQRNTLVDLANEIHQSDIKNGNTTNKLIGEHINQDKDIHIRQTTIIENQKIIVQTLEALMKEHGMVMNRTTMLNDSSSERN